MKERWRPFPLDTRYAVSTLGRVRRVSNKRVRNPCVKHNGYLGLVFTKPGYIPKVTPGVCKGYEVHAMVALTFLGPRPKGLDVSHLNGNKLDNRLVNLAYETRRVNSNKPFNAKWSRARKLSIATIRKVRNSSGKADRQWAAELECSPKTIWKIRTNRTYKDIK